MILHAFYLQTGMLGRCYEVLGPVPPHEGCQYLKKWPLLGPAQWQGQCHSFWLPKLGKEMKKKTHITISIETAENRQFLKYIKKLERQYTYFSNLAYFFGLLHPSI